MALNWSMQKVKDLDLLHNTMTKGQTEPPFPKGSPEDLEGDRQWQISEGLIFATMSVGMNSITEANAEKFYARLLMVSEVFGKPLMKWDEEKQDHVKADYTFADVRRRIGLGTNASQITDAAFRKRMIEEIERRCTRKARNEAQAVKEQVEVG